MKNLKSMLIVMMVFGLSHSVFATDQPTNPQKNSKGRKTFTNPFLDAPEEIDDELYLDNPEDFTVEGNPPENRGAQVRKRISRPSSKPKQEIRVNPRNAGTPPKDVPEPKFTQTGIQVGGESPGGVVSESKRDPLYVNPYTGSGSNQVITDFNYPDADIMDIARTIGKLTGKNFILDKDVKGRITIISNSPITVADAWKAFLSALDINGYTLIPAGKYIRIARLRDARDKQLKIYTGEYSPGVDALITRVFPLKHIAAEEVARTFRSFMPANSRIIPYGQTNTVIVTDTGSNIQKLAKMLEFLDVEGFDAGIIVVPVQYASAVELAKLIDTLIPGTEASRGSKKRSRVFGRSSFQARRTREGGIINTIIADERTNTLIINANEKGAEQVRELVARLDRKVPAPIGGGRIHVVYLQFGDAEKIAQTLNNLSQTRPSRSKSSKNTKGTGSNPTSSVLFEGDIRVSADKETNSLVITASPTDFVTIQRVIGKLDIPRDEVYVETIIMEITMGDNFNYSPNLILPDKGIALTPNTDLLNFLQNPLSANGLVLGFKRGATKTLNVGGNDIEVSSLQALITAIQRTSQANILATPQILTLDNTEAIFESGERIPFESTTTNPNGTTQTSITRQQIGLQLKIKPQINKVSNFVKLEIEAKLEDITDRALPASLQQKAVATVDRSAKTTVVVADGDTVVLGGLIRDKTNETTSKVPLLGDIPILGWLFKSRTSQVEKTNMLVFLTPTIIRNYEKVRDVLTEKMKERDQFVADNLDGEDPLKKYRDKIIKSLPKRDAVETVKTTPSEFQTEYESDRVTREELKQDQKDAAVYVPEDEFTEEDLVEEQVKEPTEQRAEAEEAEENE